MYKVCINVYYTRHIPNIVVIAALFLLFMTSTTGADMVCFGSINL